MLDQKSFEIIHAKVLNDGNLIRTVTEFIGVTVQTEQINAALVLKNGKAHNTQETIEMLKIGGFSLVNSGQGGLVNQLLDTLPQTYRNDQEIALIYAYVKFHSGFALDALSWLPKGFAREKLSLNNQALAKLIESCTQFSLRIITQEDYVKRLMQIEEESRDTVLGLQIKVERIRKSISNGADGKLEKVIYEMKEAMSHLLSLPEIDKSIQINAKTILWELGGWEYLHELADAKAFQETRTKIGFPMPLKNRKILAKKLYGRFQEWLDRYRQLKLDTQDNPVAYGQIVINASSVILRSVAQAMCFSEGAIPDYAPAVKGTINSIEYVLPTLSNYGLSYLVLRGKLIQAEALEALEETWKAKELRSYVKGTSQELGLIDIQQMAEEQLSGDGIFSTAKKIKNEVPSFMDEDIRGASHEEMKEMAQYFVNATNIPMSRIDNIVKDFEWMKKDAENRYSFCRYIDNLQFLEHCKSLDTMYSIDPDRVIVCTKFGFESSLPGKDRDNLLLLFI